MGLLKIPTAPDTERPCGFVVSRSNLRKREGLVNHILHVLIIILIAMRI
jgi:hypothetical protein